MFLVNTQYSISFLQMPKAEVKYICMYNYNINNLLKGR